MKFVAYVYTLYKNPKVFLRSNFLSATNVKYTTKKNKKRDTTETQDPKEATQFHPLNASG
jgi:hypothetical protein